MGSLIFGVFITLAVYALVVPWSFHIGGRLYIYFYPYLRATTRLLGHKAWPATGLRGRASVCTKAGEVYRFRLSGDIYGAWLNSDGMEVGFSLMEPRGPKLRRAFDLYGVWHGPELVLDDHKTMFMNIRPDGTLTPTGQYTSPVPEKHAHVTLTWGSYSAFASPCRSLRTISAGQ